MDAVVRSTPTTDGTISPSEQSSFLVSNISQEQEKSKQEKTLNEQLAEARAEKEELLSGYPIRPAEFGESFNPNFIISFSVLFSLV